MEMVAFKGYTHLSIALVIGINLFRYVNIDLIFIAFILLGSIFPDIDYSSSMMGKYNPFAAVMTHRGFTHTIVAMLTFSTLVLLLNSSWGIAFCTGYLSHLLMDALNPTGVMFLYPVMRKHIHFANIRTGSPGEVLLFFIAVWYLFV